MTAQCRHLVVLATLCVLAPLCIRGAPAPPAGAHLLLCRPFPTCGDEVFNPEQYCCHDHAVVPLSTVRKCGNCTFSLCHEQCCPGLYDTESLVVKAKGQDCSSELSSEDRVCSEHPLIQDEMTR
ncbi:insulin growth factor-like family member 1 [Dasypus novemcinctus]|uniref:insulin growth factor-like family member 1 n=1 Tax=Dasypus novemcinctus TaxID=9361 RepID=UPI00265EE997|nr:insulin growth factor-like family member 1 [Dasypus novemcinctus]